MKTFELYDRVLKEVKKLDNVKPFDLDSSITTILEGRMEHRLQMRIVAFLQGFLFVQCTVEQLKAIVQEQEIESSWNNEKFSKSVLPKEVYCNSAEYAKEEKLRILMPNKVFR